MDSPETAKNFTATPVDGKYVFQVDDGMRVRFNADGWVEEIGKGGAEDPIGTKLQGKPSSKRDDVYARRFYDLYTRAVLLDIHPKIEHNQAGTGGLVLFRDLEAGSTLYNRVSKIIAIANQAFNMNIAPLRG